MLVRSSQSAARLTYGIFHQIRFPKRLVPSGQQTMDKAQRLDTPRKLKHLPYLILCNSCTAGKSNVYRVSEHKYLVLENLQGGKNSEFINQRRLSLVYGAS
jgi:hypothetical protein